MNKDCICKIRNVYRAIATFEDTLQRQFGLNINEAMLLSTVAGHENISSGEIAEELSLTHSNASKVIVALENSGLIRRKLCKEDKRCMRFGITQKGKDLLTHVNCDQVQVPENLKKIAG